MRKVSIFLMLPLACILFGCDVQRAVERNKIAVQQSTDAIERNIEALDKVTAQLESMQKEGE